MGIALFSSRLIWLLPLAGLATAPVTVTLATRNNSGISGTAVLTASGDSTRVELTLKGGRPGESLMSHIHFGTCQQPGGVVVPLATVTFGADSSGSSRTTVATRELDAARRAHSSLLIQTHMADGKPAACGDVPAS